MIDFVKMMAAAHCDVRPYVALGTITADEYKMITGKDYVAA
ncbi:XkdX family protein [Lacticaseibacillus pantheris]|nr:XkdX family protein [Lacticaseibacillus pantheris]WKF86035.1 XkdX family protein [Lacticaseibacillus pantheris]